MDLVKHIISGLAGWLPEWQAGLYISILAILILTGKSRAALVLLFISAYVWGITYFKNNPLLMGVGDPLFGDPLFPAVFYASGILIGVGVIILFWIRRSR